MDENLYDEFGNYIGPDIPDIEEDLAEDEEEERRTEGDRNEDDKVFPVTV